MESYLKSLIPSLQLPSKKEDGEIINVPYAIGFAPEIFIPKAKFITEEKVNLLTKGKLSKKKVENRTRIINDRVPIYGLDVLDVFEEFAATILHESNYFTKKEEDLYYSAQRMAIVWPSIFSIDGKGKEPNQLAYSLQKRPQALANNVYANRNGNGNEESGDGWFHRGSGDIQLTGKGIHLDYANYIEKSLNITSELLRIDDWYAFDSACWYFCIYKSLKDEAERDEFQKITRVVNGGLTNYKDREKDLIHVRNVINR